MALVPFQNRAGILLTPMPTPPEYAAGASATINAAGESLTFIGYVYLASGPGTSKTMSSAGGKVWWQTGSAAGISDAGTTFRIGLQDAATGVEDGTFDVSADLVGGTDSLTTNSIIGTAMEAGSKTVTHGDLIGISLEFISRGGTDGVNVSHGAGASGMTVPYATVDSGSGPGKQPIVPRVTLEFDDGTIGFLGQDSFAHNIEAPTAFGVNSTPDEHALIFRLPFPFQVSALYVRVDQQVSADDFEVILYSDPLGTPVAERTITQDNDIAATTGQSRRFERPIAPFDCAANMDYAVALRPTTTGTLSYTRLNFGSGNGHLRGATTLGTGWSLGTRTDQTGAFTQDTTILPIFGIRISQLDDATGGGGGGSTEHAYVFIG